MGAEEGEGDALLRLYQEVTPQLLLDGSLEARARSLPALNVLASISNEGLNKAQTVAPDRGEIGERAIILVSDSTLTLVSGSKRNPKHTSISDTFQASRRPTSQAWCNLDTVRSGWKTNGARDSSTW